MSRPSRSLQACATPGCGRSPQRGRPFCWFCDPAVLEEQKLAARRRRLVPDFGTIGSRRRFREGVAEATIEGEMIPPVAAVALKAAADHVDDAYRQREPSSSEVKLMIMIERFGSPVGAVPAAGIDEAGTQAASSAPPPATPLIAIEQFADSP
jgi:hypothetical protein